jgi:hypothetical protein
MSTISGVDFPSTITYGKQFNVTVRYSADPGANTVFVTGLNHVVATPGSISVDPKAGSATASLTVAAPAGGPAGSQIVMVRFTFGVADWTAAAMASS